MNSRPEKSKNVIKSVSRSRSIDKFATKEIPLVITIFSRPVLKLARRSSWICRELFKITKKPRN